MMTRRYLFLFCLILSSCAQNQTSVLTRESCTYHPEQYAKASGELKSVEEGDQQDRQGDLNTINWSKVAPRDLERRIQVADIFARGCFKTAQDYANAAMVYQHGETSDHAFQAFVWAKRAVELGDTSQKWMLAASLDRYLVRMGQKQLFATQATKDSSSPCWCLEPVEVTFPDAKRIDYAKKTLPQALQWIQALNATLPSCHEAQFCTHSLKASPIGTIPGFW